MLADRPDMLRLERSFRSSHSASVPGFAGHAKKIGLAHGHLPRQRSPRRPFYISRDRNALRAVWPDGTKATRSKTDVANRRFESVADIPPLALPMSAPDSFETFARSVIATPSTVQRLPMPCAANILPSSPDMEFSVAGSCASLGYPFVTAAVSLSSPGLVGLPR